MRSTPGPILASCALALALAHVTGCASPPPGPPRSEVAVREGWAGKCRLDRIPEGKLSELQEELAPYRLGGADDELEIDFNRGNSIDTYDPASDIQSVTYFLVGTSGICSDRPLEGVDVRIFRDEGLDHSKQLAKMGLKPVSVRGIYTGRFRAHRGELVGSGYYSIKVDVMVLTTDHPGIEVAVWLEDDFVGDLLFPRMDSFWHRFPPMSRAKINEAVAEVESRLKQGDARGAHSAAELLRLSGASEFADILARIDRAGTSSNQSLEARTKIEYEKFRARFDPASLDARLRMLPEIEPFWIRGADGQTLAVAYEWRNAVMALLHEQARAEAARVPAGSARAALLGLIAAGPRHAVIEKDNSARAGLGPEMAERLVWAARWDAAPPPRSYAELVARVEEAGALSNDTIGSQVYEKLFPALAPCARKLAKDAPGPIERSVMAEAADALQSGVGKLLDQLRQARKDAATLDGEIARGVDAESAVSVLDRYAELFRPGSSFEQSAGDGLAPSFTAAAAKLPANCARAAALQAIAAALREGTGRTLVEKDAGLIVHAAADLDAAAQPWTFECAEVALSSLGRLREGGDPAFPALSPVLARLLAANGEAWTREAERLLAADVDRRAYCVRPLSGELATAFVRAHVEARRRGGMPYSAAGGARVLAAYGLPAAPQALLAAGPARAPGAIRLPVGWEAIDARAQLLAALPVLRAMPVAPEPFAISIAEKDELRESLVDTPATHEVHNPADTPAARERWSALPRLIAQAEAFAKAESDYVDHVHELSSVTPIVTTVVDEHGRYVRTEVSGSATYRDYDVTDQNKKARFEAACAEQSALESEQRRGPVPPTIIEPYTDQIQSWDGRLVCSVTLPTEPVASFDLTIDGAAVGAVRGGPTRSGLRSRDSVVRRLRAGLSSAITAHLVEALRPGAQAALNQHLQGIADDDRRAEEGAWGRFWLALPAASEDAKFIDPAARDGLAKAAP